MSFLTSKLGLVVIAAAAVLGVTGWIYLEGRSTGANAMLVDQLERTNETQRSITDADAHGPHTPDDVDRRLRDGSF
jgi:hypothetical protein